MAKEQEVQQTLVILKPDALQRGIVGELITRFERVGLKIIAMKMVTPSRDQLYEHYENIGKMLSRRGESAFLATLEYMLTGPVVAIVLEGVGAVPLVRKIVGGTEPQTADMGTIRGDYSHMSFVYADKNHKGVPNLIHASGNPEEAKDEIKHWFKKNETHQYHVLHEKFTR